MDGGANHLLDLATIIENLPPSPSDTDESRNRPRDTYMTNSDTGVSFKISFADGSFLPSWIPGGYPLDRLPQPVAVIAQTSNSHAFAMTVDKIYAPGFGFVLKLTTITPVPADDFAQCIRKLLACDDEHHATNGPLMCLQYNINFCRHTALVRSTTQTTAGYIITAYNLWSDVPYEQFRTVWNMYTDANNDL